MRGPRQRKPGGSSAAAGVYSGSASGLAPGKRTRTQRLAGPIMRKATSRRGPSAAAKDQVGKANESGGSPLPPALRGDLEPSLGADLSGVRVHTGAESAAAADGLNAKAYALGQDIHFASGEYAPSSSAGAHLIAHEVAHTVQQQGGAAEVRRSATVSQPGDSAEREADRFADAFSSGASTSGLVTPGLQPAAAIHRFGRDEHADLSTSALTNLYEYLRTPEGKKWAKDHGYADPADLIKRMEADPVVKTYKEPLTKEETAKHSGPHVARLQGAKTKFTYGELTAMMGDLFGHWESLYNADEEQRKHLMTEDTTASNEKYTKGEYLKLAANNDSHFAGKNKEAWLAHHNKALEAAAQAGSDDAAFERALFIDAAGSHFLTDAFSAGHQFEKATVFNAALIDVQKHFIESDNKELQTYVAIAGAADRNNIPNLMVKAIHDKMNFDGFEVTNGKGMKWRTLGDGNLARSAETQRIAALAVFESRQQVIKARGSKTPPPVKEVMDFFPNDETKDAATTYALSMIPWARKQVEQIIYAERKQASVKLGNIGGYLAEHNLEALGDPARERNILQQQEFDRRNGGDGSVVAPQLQWRFGK